MSAALVRRLLASCRRTSAANGAAVNNIFRLGRDERGAVALFAGLTLMLICGAVGLAIDIGFWYRTARAMQNAADAAVVAVARDRGNQNTGKAVAAQYGFVHNVDDTQITIGPEPCPSGGTDCFKATIDSAAPQFFSKVLDIPAPRLSVSATASLTAGSSLRQYCIIALATSGTSPAIRTNGAPAADLGNCDIVSNTSMTCHGHDLNAKSADSVGNNNGCGKTGTRLREPVADPVAGLVPNIPSSVTSAARSAATSLAAAPSATSETRWPRSTKVLQPAETIAGNLVLDGDVTVTTPATGSVIYISNGTLNLNGHRLKTAVGSGLTIVFTGINGNSTADKPYPTGGGTLNIEAPKTGPWAGVAIYIDPRTTRQLDITYHGNSPTWKITGLVYMPHASLTVSGAVGKSSNGGACFELIVDNLRINGTGSILVRPGDCPTAGVSLPGSVLPNGAPALVL
jgi:hypothetical protein